MVWGQPYLGVGIKEGEEIEAGWRDPCNGRDEVKSHVTCCHQVPHLGTQDLLSPFTFPPWVSSLVYSLSPGAHGQYVYQPMASQENYISQPPLHLGWGD